MSGCPATGQPSPVPDWPTSATEPPRVNRRCGRRSQRPPGLAPEQLLITPGARQALLLAFASLPADRREILLPRPYWASYPALAGTVGARLRIADRLEAAVGPATGAVLINSPRNPDGAVLDAGRLAELVAWTGAAGLLLIFDQVYRGVPLPGPIAPSPLDLPGGLPAHCLVVDGLAKSHALAGLRIGWLAAAPTVLAPITALAGHLIGGTSSAAQDAALAALQAGPGSELGRKLADNRELRRGPAGPAGRRALPGAGRWHLPVPGPDRLAGRRAGSRDRTGGLAGTRASGGGGGRGGVRRARARPTVLRGTGRAVPAGIGRLAGALESR